MISQFVHASYTMRGLSTTVTRCYVCMQECYVRAVPKRKKVLCPTCATAAHQNERIVAQNLRGKNARSSFRRD